MFSFPKKEGRSFKVPRLLGLEQRIATARLRPALKPWDRRTVLVVDIKRRGFHRGARQALSRKAGGKKKQTHGVGKGPPTKHASFTSYLFPY